MLSSHYCHYHQTRAKRPLKVSNEGQYVALLDSSKGRPEEQSFNVQQDVDLKPSASSGGFLSLLSTSRELGFRKPLPCEAETWLSCVCVCVAGTGN